MAPQYVSTILVCGGRDYGDARRIREVLSPYLPSDPKDGTPTIVHGGAPGADHLADGVATSLGFWVEVIRAPWKRFSRAAGHLRNERMAMRVARDIEFGVLCIAFPGGSGTADMIRRAERHGIPVRRIT